MKSIILITILSVLVSCSTSEKKEFKIEKGKHLFTLKGRGDSPKMRHSFPKKYYIGISSLILLRIEDL